MKTYNTEFGDIIITFIDGNVRPLEMEGKVDFGYIIITFNDQNGRPLEIEGKVHNEKMKWSEWFIRRSIFCQEEYKIQNSMLRSIFCDYRDTYLVGRDSKTVTRNDNAGRKKKMPIFKNNAPFRSCISQIHRQCNRSWYCYADVLFARVQWQLFHDIRNFVVLL